MNIFEDPNVIIIAFIIGFLLLGGIGLYFAVRGIKMANGQEENGFITISKMESLYKKLGKQRAARCLLYVTIFSDNLHTSTTETKAFEEIKQYLLNTFSDGDSVVAEYDEKNLVVLACWNEAQSKAVIDSCDDEINRCLLKHGTLNVLDVKVGMYVDIGSHVFFDDALSRAKQACMLAKNKNLPSAKWDSSSGKALEKKIKIENNIEKEIDNNRFFLEYQPVIDAQTRKIIGAEVLSRLNSETDGVLTPGSFLSAVDSVGINGKFDYYIFEKNCKWISNDKKQREGYKYTINFSRSTLSEPAFADKIIGIAQKYDLKLSCLAVEILEDKNITGEAKQQMIDNLSMLKEKGVSILLDDFGSGFTTFGDLQNLDISIVKIDKAITQNGTTETGFIILKNIIRTSQDIGFKTLCEGIETKEQEEAAIAAGCDLLQGYYYYRPMPVTMLEKLFVDSNGGE